METATVIKVIANSYTIKYMLPELVLIYFCTLTRTSYHNI